MTSQEMRDVVQLLDLMLIQAKRGDGQVTKREEINTRAVLRRLKKGSPGEEEFAALCLAMTERTPEEFGL